MTPAVETHSLTKRYGDFVALDACSIEIPQGEIFGLLGPNGAGKTTFLRLLMGYLRPSDGRGRIFGLDCYRRSNAIRLRSAYLPGEARLFRTMRGRQILDFFSQMHPKGDRRRADELATLLDVDLQRKVSECSTGMRQKLALAAVLSIDADLVVLDEPTANLDPTVRRQLLAHLRELRQRGKTILFSSHVLSESEDVCDRVAILRAGRLAHVQCLKDLKRQHRITAKVSGSAEAPDSLRDKVAIQRNGERFQVQTDAELSDLLAWLGSLELKSLRIEPIGLQAVYDQFHPEAD